MTDEKRITIDSPLGWQEIDHQGPPESWYDISRGLDHYRRSRRVPDKI